MTQRIGDLPPASAKPALTVRNPHTRPSDAFRRNLRAYRKRRGWRQADLAERLGRERSVISLLENGRREISLDEAIAICATLGVSPLSLLSQDNAPIEVAPGELVEGFIFRAWLRGNAWVRPDDSDYMPAGRYRRMASREATSVSLLL